jgi:hypothetical protein
MSRSVVLEERPLVSQCRIEIDDSEGLDQPIGFDGYPLADRTADELGVPAVVHPFGLVPLDPNPEQFVVAADVEFGSREAGFGTEPKSPWTLEYHTGAKTRHARAGEGGMLGRKRPNTAAILVDRPD